MKKQNLSTIIKSIVFLGSLAMLMLGACGQETGFESCEVIYSYNHAVGEKNPLYGNLTGDWNADGIEDSLVMETEELEGSIYIGRIEINFSGSSLPYVLEGVGNYSLLDIVPINLDQDADTEVLLLFDMDYNGANGCIGLQLLDYSGTVYENCAGGYFTGEKYSVIPHSEGQLSVKGKLGKDMILDGVTGFSGTVTGAYAIEIIENEKMYYLRLNQYIAGQFMVDHIGDVVGIYSFENGSLQLIQENAVAMEVAD